MISGRTAGCRTLLPSSSSFPHLAAARTFSPLDIKASTYYVKYFVFDIYVFLTTDTHMVGRGPVWPLSGHLGEDL